MAIDPEFRKLLNGAAWASGGDRTDLDDTSVSPTIARNIGWQASFSTTDTPARTRMNQILRELYGAAKELGMGVSLYDATVSYPINAIVQHSSKLWRAQSAHDANNPVAPAGSGQSVWQEIASTNVVSATQPDDISNNDILIDYDNGSNFRVYWNAPDDGGSDITQYDVRYSKSQSFSSGVYTLSNYTQGTTISANVPAGEANLFYVQVRARNAIGTPSWPTANGKQVGIAALAPEAINFISATPGSGSVVLNWGLPFMRGLVLHQYRVEWRSGNQSFTNTGTRHSNIPAGTTTATISGLSNGTSYTFRVIAESTRSTETAGAYTVTSTPTAGTQASVPGTPINLSMARGVGSGTLVAQTNAIPDDNGAKITSFGWRIRQAASGEGGVAGAWQTPSSPNNATTNSPINTFTGIAAGEWEVEMRATNSAGNSAWSNRAKSSPYYPSLPSAPSVETATSRTPSTGGGVIAFINEEITDGGADITAIEWRRKLTSASDTPANWNVLSSTGTPMLIERTETAGTSVDFSARAVNSAGKGLWSDAESIVPPSAIAAPVVATAPDAPAIAVSLHVGSNSGPKVIVNLTEDIDDNGAAITSFTWQYRLSTTATWSTYSVPSLQQGQPYAAIGDGLLTAGSTYVFRARATNSVGNSAWSNTVSITPTLSLLRGLPSVNQYDFFSRFNGTPGEIYLWFPRWTDISTNGSDITQMQISMRYPAGSSSEPGPWITTGTYALRFATFNLTSVSGLPSSVSSISTSFGVRVRVRNSVGWSAWTNEREFADTY